MRSHVDSHGLTFRVFIRDPLCRIARKRASEAPSVRSLATVLPCPHFRLLELGGGNRPVESGAQFLGCVQGQLNPRSRPGFKASVDKIERSDIASGAWRAWS